MSKTSIRIGITLTSCLAALSAALFLACGSSDADDESVEAGSRRGDGDAADRTQDGSVACTPVVFARRDGELFLVVDFSMSMTGPKITAEKNGVLRFVTDPASQPLYVGLVRNPPDGSVATWCEPASYADAAVPIVKLADVDASGAFTEALAPPLVAGGSPWSGALGAGADAIVREAALHPDRNVAMVFLADEVPNRCELEAGALTAIVAGPASKSPSLRTFVVGMLSMPADAAVSGFEALAAAGGTAPATVLVNPDPSGASVEEALDRARDDVACELEAPSELWATVADGTRPPTVVTAGGAYVAQRVDGRAQCPRVVSDAGAGASDAGQPLDAGLSPESVAYFAPRPGVIALCPEACRALLRDGAGRLEARCP